MGRQFNERHSYDKEAGKLLELCRLVESDKARPEPWKADIAKRLRALAMELLGAPGTADDAT